MRHKTKEAMWTDRYKSYIGQVGQSNNPFSNLESFKAKWEQYKRAGKKDIMRNFVYETKYNGISYDTYKSMRDLNREYGRLKRYELLNMTTREFADVYQDVIEEERETLLKQFPGEKWLVASLLSQFAFGS